MLSPADKPELDCPVSIIYYRVKDIQKEYELFLPRGVSVEEKPDIVAKLGEDDLWMCSLRELWLPLQSPILKFTVEVES